MGDLVQLHPPVAIGETFHHVETLDTFGQSELLIARSEKDGRPVLSLLLSDLPADGSFEILASLQESKGTDAALRTMARAVSLALLHMLPDATA